MSRPSRGPWWTQPESPPLMSADPPADRVEVAIVGGGLAGLACALFLARSGARVCVFEARDALGTGASGRNPGLVFSANGEPPFRLLHALGPARMRDLHALSDENVALLASETVVARTGGLWATVDAREPAQLDESLAALDTIGATAALWSAEQVAAATGARGLGPALHLPNEVLIDPARAITDLAAAARAAGATLHPGARVRGIGDAPDGVALHLPDHTVHAEVVVVAAESESADVHPFFEDKITPVRETALLTEPVDLPLRLGVRAQYGYFTLRRHTSGGLVVRGARWATPSMEVGETTEVPNERVQAKIEAFVAARFGPLAVRDRWAWIEGHPCDGLPIVGPLPGSARVLSCVGFAGNAPGLAVRCARAIADGLLTGRAPGVPTWLTPQRFVP